MGIMQRSGRKVRLSPAFGLPHLPRVRTLKLPPDSPTGLAAAQSFASLAGNALAVAYPTLVNPLLLNGTAGGANVYGLSQPTGAVANRGVYLTMPTIVSFKSSVNEIWEVKIRIRGINHLGQSYLTPNGYVEVGSSNGFGFYEGAMCWTFIDTVEFLSYNLVAGGAATGNITAGWTFAHSAQSFNRLPIPWDLGDYRELIGAVLLDAGGGATVFASWAPVAGQIGAMAQVTTTVVTQGAPASLRISGTVGDNKGPGTLLFTTGNCTVVPTAPIEFMIVAAPAAINSH